MFANSGHTVRGVDIDASKIEGALRGEVGTEEPGLTDQLSQAVAGGRLSASTSFSPADVFVIAVPTPVSGDLTPDISFVLNACRSVADHLTAGNLVIVESTIPPGATVNDIAPALEQSGLRAGQDFSIAYCPERVLPGNIMAEIVGNDRIIGGIDEHSTEMATGLYRSFVTGQLHQTNATTAEMVKLAENTYRDVNIALANTLANISESVGVSVWDVVEMANMHPRVDIHRPGPGVGGHCIPVDPWFLVSAGDSSAELIRTARTVNDAQPNLIAQKALALAGGPGTPRIAVLGAAYKPDVSDARESPTSELVSVLSRSGAVVTVHDPNVDSFDPELTGSRMRNQSVLDTCNVLDREAWTRSGFEFHRYAEPD